MTASRTGGAPGDPITFTYVLTNTGKQDLFQVSVTDDQLGEVGSVDSLAGGQSATFTRDTTIRSQALTYTATAVGQDKHGRTTSATDSVSITVVLGETIVRAPIVRGRVLAETGAC